MTVTNMLQDERFLDIEAYASKTENLIFFILYSFHYTMHVDFSYLCIMTTMYLCYYNISLQILLF